jgi:hypothetical protein
MRKLPIVICIFLVGAVFGVILNNGLLLGSTNQVCSSNAELSRSSLMTSELWYWKSPTLISDGLDKLVIQPDSVLETAVLLLTPALVSPDNSDCSLSIKNVTDVRGAVLRLMIDSPKESPMLAVIAASTLVDDKSIYRWGSASGGFVSSQSRVFSTTIGELARVCLKKQLRDETILNQSYEDIQVAVCAWVTNKIKEPVAGDDP